MAMIGRKAAESSGQMTVELCVVFPVVIAIAVIATNAMSFFGCCAEFDRVARNAVRTFAASPEYEQASGQVAARIESEVSKALCADNLECSVSMQADYRGFEQYRLELAFAPTLFGMGLKDEVFGVAMPRLTHETRLMVDPYRPGELL